MAAMQYKLEGNRLFSQKKYEEAIKQYTKAIVMKDCKVALEKDSQSVKGHFFMGQCDVELEKFDDAIVHLTKAHDLAKQQKLNFGDDIAATLRAAKKRKWDKAEQLRIQQEIDLQVYLNGLITKDMEREIGEKKEEIESLNETESEEFHKNLQSKYDSKKEELNSLFAKIDERRKARDVPDYLCGKISFEIMKDPVITPSGITYDRKDIEEHLQRVGHFDPVTRNELKLNQLIPNLAMREVITNFTDENGWIEDF